MNILVTLWIDVHNYFQKGFSNLLLLVSPYSFSISQLSCFAIYTFCSVASTVTQWLPWLPHRVKALGLNLGPGPFCVEVACSPCVCVSFLLVLWFSPTVEQNAGQMNWGIKFANELLVLWWTGNLSVLFPLLRPSIYRDGVWTVNRWKRNRSCVWERRSTGLQYLAGTSFVIQNAQWIQFVYWLVCSALYHAS